MALLDNTFKQRMVGALVLIALAVIFLPMLFSRQDEMREVRVEAPTAPKVPVQPQVQVQPVQVPQQQPVAQEPIPEDANLAQEQTGAEVPPVPNTPKPQVATPISSTKPTMPIGAAPKPAHEAAAQPQQQPAAPAVATAAKPTAAQAPSKIDPNGLPVSWSVQLASLSSRDGADNMQKTLRTQGYNAYVRSADGKNRVYVGPLIDRAEAERLRDTLNRQQNLKGFVVRFEPERG
jgi:DedD protein